MDKSEIRKLLKEKRKAFSKEDQKKADAKIFENVLMLPEWQKANIIFSYVSTEEEPDTKALILKALSEKKRVFVPRCLEKPEMETVEIHSLSELHSGTMGILEPFEELASGDLKDSDGVILGIIPCLGAGKKGERLGHGGGYYDAFLYRHSMIKLCLCYEEFLIGEIPMEDFDQHMDIIVTEQEIYR